MKQTLKLCCLTMSLATWMNYVCAQPQVLQDSMAELFSIADEHNTSINSHSTALLRAQQEIDAAKAARLPDVGASLSFSYLGNGQIWDRDFTNYIKAPIPHWGNSLSVEATQVVYSGGALSSGIRLAELGKEMEQLGDDGNRKTVHMQLAALYLTRHSLYNRLEVVKSNIALADTLINRTLNRYDEGVVLKNDITRYELMREQMRLQATVVEDQIKVVDRQMKTALGTDRDIRVLPSQAFDIADEIQSEDYWQNMALTESTDLSKTMTAIEMNRQKERLARSASLPKVAVVAQDHLNGPITIDIPAIDKNFNYWFVGVGISYDISSLYKNKKKVLAAQTATKYAEEQRTVAKENIGDAVHAAYVAVLTAQSELRTRTKSMELAQQNYDVIANRYNNGLALVTDMTDAANVRLDAELQYVDAKIGVALALYKLKYVCGNI